LINLSKYGILEEKSIIDSLGIFEYPSFYYKNIRKIHKSREFKGNLLFKTLSNFVIFIWLCIGA